MRPSDGTRHANARIVVLLVVVVLAVFPGEGTAQGPPAGDVGVEEALNQGKALRSRGKHEEALALLAEALAALEKRSGPDDPGMVKLLDAQGATFGSVGRWAEAESSFRKAVAIFKKRPELPVALRIQITNNLVEVLVKLARHDEALPLGTELLATAKRELGPKDPRTNLVRGTLAKVYVAARRFEESIPIVREAIEINKDNFGTDGGKTIPDTITLACALLDTGKYEEAKQLLEESLIVARRLQPPVPEYTEAITTCLANANLSLGRTVDAEKLPVGVLKGPASPSLGASERAALKNNEAQQEQVGGRYESAEKLYLEAIDLSKQGRPDHPETAVTLINISGLYVLWGRYADAERRALQSLAITRKNPGPGSEIEARGKTVLAMIHLKTGRHREARTLFDESYQILKARLQPGHPDIAFALTNLALLDHEFGDHDRAIERGEAALGDIERRLGPNNGRSAVILANLGASYAELRRFDEAEDRLRRAVAILEKEPGPPSSGLASAYNSLAEIAQLTRDYPRAEAYFRKCVGICSARLGPDHPNTSAAIENLASSLSSQDRWDEAADEFDRSRRSRRTFLDRTLPSMSEDDQYQLIESGERSSRDAALSMAVGRQELPRLVARSAEWVLNSKALTFRAMAQRSLLARDSSNPEAARLIAELDQIRGKLARLALARDVPSPGAPSEDYRALVERDRQLGLALRIPSAIDPWTSLVAVRESLPDDAVLVEFARFRMFGKAEVAGGLGWYLPRYVAWIIPPKGRGDVALVDLGPAEEIESAVVEVLRGLAVPPEVGADAEAERKLLEPLRILSGKLLKPLEGHLEPARRWVLSPDAALWLVPWAALPDSRGRYAVERHLIHLTVSGRELLVPPSASAANPPAILADPDYDLGVGLAVAKAKELGMARGGRPAPSRGRGTLRSESLDAAFGRLPATGSEARAIAPLMKAFAGAEPRMFLGPAASETVLKALRSPRVLVLSTHGFFLEDLDPDPDARRSAAPEVRALPANPLLRSGLILAGYNRARSVGEEDSDDGLVTGLEVASCDLRGTDLVVLSACETGQGKIRAGEGVAGLRQVFQLAGARAVVASLWKVPDVESFQLMAAFFEGLSRGRCTAEALREAELAMIADRRARFGAAHPYFWAAFALTGFPGTSWREEALAEIGSKVLPTLSQPPSEVFNPGPGEARATSPITGLPEAGNPWVDSALAAALLAAGGWAGRRWWKHDGRAVS